MHTVAITGSEGFIGKHLARHLETSSDIEVLKIVKNEPLETLKDKLLSADTIYHLAGQNRPEDPKLFEEVNTQFTSEIATILASSTKPLHIIFSSSTQAEGSSRYGKSKLAGELALKELSIDEKNRISIFRLPNVFGARARPNYNSVIATFCHNINNDIPIDVHDGSHEVEFIWVGDLVKQFAKLITETNDTEKFDYLTAGPTHSITIGDLVTTIESFKHRFNRAVVPTYKNRFERLLHSTYLSYKSPEKFGDFVDKKTDDRGWLFELVRSQEGGQVFASSTKPGITRGNHFHTHKIEKFCVVSGEAKICLRDVFSSNIIEYQVTGNDIQVINIPPFYTHSITNIGDQELLTLFWTSEEFNPSNPDTTFEDVRKYE